MAEPAAVHPSTTRGLTGALLSAALMPLNSTMIAVAVPTIAEELDHRPATVTQALVATYLIAAIALQSPGGKLGDRIGHWRVFAVGQAVIGLGAVLGFLAPTLELLAVSRILIAGGGALVVPATVALLRVGLPPERRGRAFGTFGAVMALAAALGPILGGVLVDAFGWEAVFLANLPVLAVSALLVATVQHTATAGTTAAFDWVGSALLTAGLVLAVLGAQHTGGGALLLLAGGAAVLIAFGWWERRVPDPVVALDLFRSRAFTAGTLLIGLQNLVMYALLFELPLVLESRLATSAGETGRLLVVLLVAMVLMSPIAGRLTDRFGARPLAVCGSLLCLAGIAALLASDLESTGEIRVPLALLGLGIGLTSPAAQTASLSAVPPERSGMAAGVSSTMRYLGGVAGIALLGQLLDLDVSRARVLAEHHTVLGVFAGALAVGLVCSLALPGRAMEPAVSPRAA